MKTNIIIHPLLALLVATIIPTSRCRNALGMSPARAFAKALLLPAICTAVSVVEKSYVPDSPVSTPVEISRISPASEEFDVYKDSGLRYLGYANEVGEALGPLYKNVIGPSYGVAISYILADTVDKYSHAVSTEANFRDVFKVTLDTFTWQLFASVILPGVTIHEITRRAKEALDSEETELNAMLKTWAPTVIGLLCIPIIIGPIDAAVSEVLDLTLRELL
jgi:fission process protein 1